MAGHCIWREGQRILHGFRAVCGACSDLQTVPPLRADIALRNADPLVTGKNDPKMSATSTRQRNSDANVSAGFAKPNVARGR